MRRKDREMPKEFACEVADKCLWAVLGMTDEDGAPYTVPVSIARDGDRLYFHSAMEGRKASCMRRDPRVSVCCVGDIRVDQAGYTVKYESAIFEGRASEVTGDEEKLRAMELICRRYAPEYMDRFAGTAQKSLKGTALWRIDIETASGKRNK